MVETITRFCIWTQADHMCRRIKLNHTTWEIIKEIEKDGGHVTIGIVGTDVVIDAPLRLIFAIREMGYDVEEAGGRRV